MVVLILGYALTDIYYTFLVTFYLVTILDNPCSLMQQSKGQKSIFSWGIACKRQNSLHCLGVAQIWNGCRKWRYFKAIKLDKGQILWDPTWSKKGAPNFKAKMSPRLGRLLMVLDLLQYTEDMFTQHKTFKFLSICGFLAFL